jgi:hypothetical protein
LRVDVVLFLNNPTVVTSSNGATGPEVTEAAVEQAVAPDILHIASHSLRAEAMRVGRGEAMRGAHLEMLRNPRRRHA